MSADYVIRAAIETDCGAINSIYNYYVETSTCTYQLEPSTIEERIQWFRGHSPKHPVIVAESSDGILGWGSLSPFRPRAAYRFTVENSIYIRNGLHRKGLGSALLERLIELAKQHGFHSIIAGIDGEQLPSIAIHKKFGFKEVAELKQVGFKFDRWLDVVYYQLMLE